VETTLSGKKLPLGAKGPIIEIRREHITVHFSDYGMTRDSIPVQTPTRGLPVDK
jgi:hypothetical protein